MIEYRDIRENINRVYKWIIRDIIDIEGKWG